MLQQKPDLLKIVNIPAPVETASKEFRDLAAGINQYNYCDLIRSEIQVFGICCPIFSKAINTDRYFRDPRVC